MDLDYLMKDRRWVYAFHLLVVAPLLGYLAYAGIHGGLAAIPQWTWWLMATLAAGVLLYHGSKLWDSTQ